MKYKIIALDIDGTLTNSKKEITKRTYDALIDYQDRGGIIVLASGRPTPGLKKYVNWLHLDNYGGYVLSYNGAHIENVKTGEVVHDQTVPNEYIPSLYEFAVKNDLGIVTYKDNFALCGNGQDEFLKYEANLNGLTCKDVDDFPNYISFPVNKLLMTAEGDMLARKERELAKQYDARLSIYRSEDFFLEIMPKNVDKAQSLLHLLNALDLTQENLIACGDGHNDKTMIAYAGLGVAMDNAKDEVKRAANVIAKSNDEDGVALIVEEYCN
ncbi:MAG: Cof-type HAD-IIB family hydrolase [Lachnospiraceae bacterium]|nr:Cof-type HAD-IIB family hydrolase [Lachnospiraceae bacterium]